MLPGAAGGVVKDLRAAARANIVLGLAMAAMALVAATTNPSDFHAQAQIIEHASPAQAPAPGALQCAVTEAEVLNLRATALLLVLTGVGQAFLAFAADVALAGSLRDLGGFVTFTAYLIGAVNAFFLCNVVSQVVVVAIGHCAVLLAVGYAFVAGTYATLLGVSIAVTLC
ncbi:uncharacterized protein [Lolium perenne]|uniref:uncharacterized protein n=1 Tax=Lolium perenne TaxID=4522 RepID=UPI0021EA04C0|nr:uncharacterized protein LOC127306636 [Lolium perenne]